MKKILAITALFAAIGYGQTLVNVVEWKNYVVAGGVNLLIDEEFETPGYDLAWTETDTNAIINDQSTTTVPTGGGTYSWFIDGSGNTAEPDTYAYHDYGGTLANPHWGRAYVYVSSATPNIDEFFLIVGNSTTFNSTVAYRFTLGVTSSAINISGFAFGGTTEQMAGGSLNTWYRLEWKYDTTTGTLNWWIDGTAQTASNGSTGRTPRYVQLGTTELGEGYVDRVAFSDEGLIGTQ